ncbi:MAG TPA: pyruvate ferredoxin oxidoreductase, partial [bacterium]|nr:pyruvate ferredoxin oxidoreductase [bacterium]
QPLEVRVGAAPEVARETVAEECERRTVKNVRVRVDDLPDTRMQNIALMAAICREGLIPGIKKEHYEAAMGDLMEGRMLEKNRALFARLIG